MSPETSKLADALRNQASAAIARGQGNLDDRDSIEFAWDFFQIMIEKSKKYAAEKEELQNKIAQTEKEIEMTKKALNLDQTGLQKLESSKPNRSR